MRLEDDDDADGLDAWVDELAVACSILAVFVVVTGVVWVVPALLRA